MSETTGTPGHEPVDSTIHALAALYALDALDADEMAAFEAHLTSCEACRRDVESYREAAASLGEAVAVTPPEGLRATVLSQVATTPQVPIA